MKIVKPKKLTPNERTAVELMLNRGKTTRSITNIEVANRHFSKVSGHEEITGKNLGRRLYHLLHSYTHKVENGMVVNLLN